MDMLLLADFSSPLFGSEHYALLARCENQGARIPGKELKEINSDCNRVFSKLRRGGQEVLSLL